ncbi:hypothetical protein [Actinospica sp.]|jgi:hypothetical protein|uniref:hypothetical protein n=1 Tax=Actinospica sp. TaxID=1872142 RepID=UPI002C81F1A8|nr:hypothetical protein [Actinospica sp.]HWG26388.1 hypothetical protein [Actinospica sp.]
MRRALALILTATALTAGAVGTAEHPAHAASFAVYFANDEHESAADIEQYGAADSATVYDDWSLSCSTTGCSNVPSQSVFESKVQDYVSLDKSGSTHPITLDFENILPVSATSTAQAAQEVSLWHELITWAHDAEPSAPIGMYSYDWNSAYASYTAELYASGYLDYFAPSMYNRWSSTSTWASELSTAVSNDHSIDSALPIYPYVEAIWDDGSSGYLSGTDWDSEFQQIESRTQGVVLWNTGPLSDSTACGWLEAFSSEMGGLTGTASSGPLTVSDSTSGTGCVVPSGETRTVTFTLANDGSSTSGATTMSDDTGGPDGITLGDFEYWDIPALAPGASYGPDSANLTVPSGASVTTALLYLDYGTGRQRVAVIIS